MTSNENKNLDEEDNVHDELIDSLINDAEKEKKKRTMKEGIISLNTHVPIKVHTLLKLYCKQNKKSIRTSLHEAVMLLIDEHQGKIKIIRLKKPKPQTKEQKKLKTLLNNVNIQISKQIIEYVNDLE